ncbi:MAG TPA: hypothetical protein PLZ58_02560 [Candidatus Saccharibacteria bacterium]|nr:hypothetical protein [Candidatus Saccharibacteria bacterium]HRQ06657.1 hypothetical protein [Candidatus Saccharibacteria bacterium]
MDEQCVNDIATGIEINLMTQEQVVSEFRNLASKDLAFAALHYGEFADKLDTAATGGNTQLRSMIGGPDSLSRAELIDVLAQNYSETDNETKKRIIVLAVEPLLRDNSFYVQMTIAKMSNPHIIADIIRMYPIYNPGADFYERDLLKGDNLVGPGSMQMWLDKFGNDYFAAMALALQTQHSTDVESVIDANKELFEGAAHIVASHHDAVANEKLLKGTTLSKSELLQKYQSSFVSSFVELIQDKIQKANWLKVN